MTIFEQARRAISRGYIEATFGAPDARWEGDEFWTLNPSRSDGAIGSFSINGATGLWHDFASDESGDLVDLVAALRSCGKREAAEEIIRGAGQVVQDDDRRPAPASAAKRDKPKPVIPVPEEALSALRPMTLTGYFKAKHGEPAKAWTYRDAEGRAVFAVVRFQKPDGAKDVLPFYWGVDGRWHNGQALESGRPLFKLDQIARADKATPVLVVEGEKCASVDVPGYMVTAWSGGCSAVAKTDWAPLADRQVVIWPDADDPGLKAAAAIARRIPGARILDVGKDRPKGWDIADAMVEGIDLGSFVASCPTISSGSSGPAARPDDGAPFVSLGYDGSRHYYMRRGVRIPFAIGLGQFTQSKILELADLSFWTACGLTSDQGTIKIAQAQDLITAWSREAGRYSPDRIRGAGVWRDADGIIVNEGSRLVLLDGTARSYDDHRSDFHYISSDVNFAPMNGPESAAGEGRVLEDLFLSYTFARPVHAILAMGWALIAPFGGILKWRPHVWVTGRRGTGKSYFFETLIAPLCGPFAHRGSGKDTEAGIRRALNQDARPVILDEMEPKNRSAAAKISQILELARNASSDGSGYITIAAPDGGVQLFKIRSCFAFASVQAPDEGAAIASRIIRIELKPVPDQVRKFRRTDELYGQVMDDPGRFTRRIFRALPRILADIEFIRTGYLGVLGDQRKVDQVAPLIAAAWAAQSDDTIQDTDEGREWLARWIEDLATSDEDVVEDEDAMIAHLLAAQVLTDDRKARTIAELLTYAVTPGGGYDDAEQALSRTGLRFVERDDKRFLAIAVRSDQITRILTGTPYESGYDAQLKRNRACVNQEETEIVRMKIGRIRCRLFDWELFRDAYLDEKEATN